MERTSVEAPASLLYDRKLSASAKVLWLVLRLLGPARPLALDRGTGFSRPTILKGLAELTAAGWYSAMSGVRRGAPESSSSGERWATIPAKLLAEQGVGPQAKVLYGLLQWTPQYQDQTGHFAYPGLAGLTRNSPNTIRKAVSELRQTGWLKTVQKNRVAPVCFTLCNPDASRQEAEVELARQRLEDADFGGEAIMRAWLTLLIDSDQYRDNAAPGYLSNPLTGERLQFDRYYPDRVAFEYQGPQHFGPTDLYSEEAYAKQRARDLIKRGLCGENGITLVTVVAEDLSLQGMKAKIGDLLPLRNLAEHQLLVAFLAKRSQSYRQKARRAAQKRAGAKAGEAGARAGEAEARAGEAEARAGEAGTGAE